MGTEFNDDHFAAPRGDSSDNAILDSLETASTALMANPVLSRRSFVSAAAVAGALTFLGSVTYASGTRLNAYADEAGNTHFSVYVLNREEVPIMAMRETESGKVAVGGVSVSVTSLFNQKKLTATTDVDGFAVINIRELSFESDDDSSPTYSFYGEVLATAEGYRDVYAPQAFIMSGVVADEDGVHPNTIEIPIEADDGSAYLRYVTLDDADALHYSEPAAVGDYNDIDHTFAVQVVSANTSASVQVALLIDDEEVARQTATRDGGNPRLALAKFVDKYLKIIKPGQKVKIRFSVEGEAAKTAKLPIEFQEAIVLNGGIDKGKSLTWAFDPLGQREVRPSFPISMFFDLEDTFLLGIPGAPVDIFDDPYGNFGISATIGVIPGYKNVNGEEKDPGDLFKKWAGRAGSEGLAQWKSTLKENWESSATQAYSGLGKQNAWCGAAPVTWCVTSQIEFTVMGFGTGSIADDGVYKGTFDIGLGFKLGVDGSVGSQFAVFGLPVYWNFDFKAFMQGRLSAGAAFDNWFQNIQWNHHYAGGIAVQFVFVVCAEIGISLCVGFRGVFGVGVRGYFRFMLTLRFDRSTPDTILHAQAYLEANLQLVIQSILFSKAIPIFAKPWQYPICDTDKKTSSLDDAAQAMNEALRNVDFSDAKMFTPSALGAVSEFKATMKDATALPGAESTVIAGSDGEVVVDAVSPATYTRTREFVPDGRSSLVIASGPASAPGFASPYAALDAKGKLQAGFTGTSDLAKTGTQDDFATVTTYNPHLGLIPTEQTLIYGDVYSNARLRTVSAYPRPNVEPERHTVMARLVTANVPAGDQVRARSRVCLRPWDADAHAFGDEQVVDFAVDGVDPEDRYDVDFDFEVHVDPGMEGLPDLTYATLAITSLVVEDGDEPSYEESVARQFVTFVVWCLEAELPVRVASLKPKLDEGVATYHPRAVIQKSIGSGGSTGWVQGRRCSFYYYHDKAGSEGESGIYVTTINLLGLVVRDFDLALADNTNVAFPVPNRTLVGGTFEVASEEDSAYISEGVYDKRLHTLLAWSGMDGDGSVSFVRSFRFDDANMDCDGQVEIADVASFSRRQHEAADTVFSYFTTSSVVREKRNNVVRFDPTERKLIAEEVDGYSNESNCIATADGKRMYTVHVSEGAPSGSVLSEDAAALVADGAEFYSANHYNPVTGANFGGCSTTSTIAEPTYQLFESRWIESLGAYHEFYPVARLAFLPDSVSVLTCTGGSRDFMMTNITDVDEAKADIYQVSVPDVLAVQCEDVKAASPFAAPGGTVGFYMDVSNVGNALITGFTVTVTDDAGNVVSEQAYSDLREYHQPSAENYRTVRGDDEKPVLDEAGMVVSEVVEDIRDASGILWPGFRRTYRFSFTMPEGYEGSTEFEVRLSDPRSNPYADDSPAAAVLANVTAAKESLAALAGEGEEPTLCAPAGHLSWLEADEFSESLFGDKVQKIVDPRPRPITVGAETASGVASGFSALPAKYEVEGDGKDKDKGDGDGKPDGGSGAGAGGGSGSGGSGSGKTAAKTGDAAGVAAVAAAAVAVGAAGLSAKAAKESAED